MMLVGKTDKTSKHTYTQSQAVRGNEIVKYDKSIYTRTDELDANVGKGFTKEVPFQQKDKR